jgi:gas vesicle protein
MNSSWIAKQMVDLQKTTFDNSFNAMVMVQDHSEKVAHTIFEQITWFPEEVKRSIGQWTEIYKKGRNDLKTALDENFAKARELFTQE